MSPASVSACGKCGEPISRTAAVCPHCGTAQPKAAEEGGGLPDVRRRQRTPQVEPWRAHFHAGLAHIGRDEFRDAVGRLSQALVDAPEEELAPCYSTRGYAFLCLGEYERALDDCNAALAIDPQDGEALAWRGAAHAGLGNWRNCLEDYVEAIAHAPDKAQEYSEVALANAATAVLQIGRKIQSGAGVAEDFFARGVALAFRGEYPAAVEDFTQVISLAPSAEAHFKRAECYCAMGEFGKVVADCTQALALEPGRAETHYYRGAGLRQLGRVREAAVDLLRAVKLDPKLSTAWFELGMAFEAIGQLEDAQRALTRAIEQTPTIPRYLGSRGRVHAALGRHAAAVEDLSAALEEEISVELLLARARSLAELRQTESALRDCDDALSLDPVCAAAYCARGEAQLAAGEPEKALAELGKAIRLDSRYAPSYRVRGDVHSQVERWEDACADYSRGLELPTDPRDRDTLHRHRGAAAAKLGRLAEAELDFSEALAATPDDAELLVQRGLARVELAKWPLALDDLLAAIELLPALREGILDAADESLAKFVEQNTEAGGQSESDTERLFNRARALELRGDVNKAIAEYSKVLELEGKHVPALVRRAKLLAAIGQAEAAIRDADSALELEPAQPAVRYLRAGCLRVLGRLEEAVNDLSTAIELEPKSSLYHLVRGKLLAVARRHAAAAADFTQAISLNRRDPRPLLHRGMIQLALGDSEAALRDFQASLQLDPHQPLAHQHRGDAFVQRKQWREAVQAYSTAIESNIDLVEAHARRGLALARGGSPQAALVELTKAAGRIRFDLAFAGLFETRGRIFYGMRQFARAVDDYSIAANLVPEKYDLAPLHLAWGQALWHAGAKDEAKEKFARAIELRPESPAAQRLAEWLREGGEPPPDLRAPATEVPFPEPPRIRSAITIDPQAAHWHVEPHWNQWVVRTPKGREFGPVRKEELDTWCREGRLDDQTLVLRIDWDQWCWCGEVYQELTIDSHRAANRPIPLSYLAAQSPGGGDAAEGDGDDFPKLRL